MQQVMVHLGLMARRLAALRPEINPESDERLKRGRPKGRPIALEAM
jgi:hypothetical protein